MQTSGAGAAKSARAVSTAILLEYRARERPLLADGGLTALERAGPGSCRSFRLSRSASFDPKQPVCIAAPMAAL